MDVNKFLIINPEDCFKKIGNSKIKILDCRWYLNDSSKGKWSFHKQHIPGAIFIDVESFSDKESDLPHMMPGKLFFEKKMSKLGISHSDEIIIYDQEGFFCSTRIWLMFKFFGHEKVLILNGGFKAWIRKKYKTEKEIKKFSKTIYKSKELKKFIINKKKLELIIVNREYTVIDARPKNRFEGRISEPRKNVIKGNIPKSINIPFSIISTNLGRLKKLKSLKKIFYENYNLENQKIVCMCGSGITACNILFALNFIKHKQKVFLYDGSWSEWGKIEKKN